MFYSQNDPRWKNQRLGTVNGVTIGSDGCYVTAFVNMANDCGKDITPGQLDDIFTERGMYAQGDLCYDDMLTQVYPDIVYQDRHNFPGDADLSVLDNNITVKQIIEVDANLVTPGLQTHFVYFYDFYNGVVRVIDSWSGQLINLGAVYGDPVKSIYKVVTYGYQGVPEPPVIPVEAPAPVVAPPHAEPAPEPTPVPEPAPTPTPEPTPVPEPIPAPVVTETPEAPVAPVSTPEPTPEPSSPVVPLEQPERLQIKQDAIIYDLTTMKPLEIVPAGLIVTVAGIVKTPVDNYLVTKNMMERGDNWGIPASFFKVPVALDTITGPIARDEAKLVSDGVEAPPEVGRIWAAILKFLDHLHKKK